MRGSAGEGSVNPLDRSAARGARRAALFGVVALLALAAGAPAAQAAFGVQSFTAGVLLQNTSQFPGQPACDFQDAINQTAGSSALYASQAGSHPYCGFTSFTMNNSGGNPGGTLADVRVDLPPGLVPNPQATPQCAQADFGSCAADTQVGTESLVAYVPSLGIEGCYAASCPSGTTQLGGALPLYNMVPSSPDQVADFAFSAAGSRVDVIGGVRDVPSNGQPGDFGEYFTITSLPQQASFSIVPGVPLTEGIQTVSSTLVFFGDPGAQDGGASGTAFLTDPSTCIGPQTTFLAVDSYENRGNLQDASFTTPIGATGCNSLTFPSGSAAPSISVTPTDAGATSFQRDTPSGLRVDLSVPQDDAYSDLATPQVQNVSVTLPPGFTINPSAASGLQGCSDAQFSAGSKATITCPPASVIGTASITSPVLASPLTGDVYLGQPPTTGNPYRIFLDAEGDGVTVRLQGAITPDPNTGQLTTTFANNPQVPFSDLALQFNGGPGAVIASSLACGAPNVSAALTPYSGAAAATPTRAVPVAADEHGAACPSTPAFTPSTSATFGTLAAGARTILGLTFSRGDGQQYLSQIDAQLPPGLLGLLASVPLCAPATGDAGACAASSQIGVTTVSAGAGARVLTLSGPVDLTGPTAGAPFGLSIPVHAVAGPYDLGTVVVRAGISVSASDAHLSISSVLPQILQGIPLRLRTVTIAINRSGFLFNPTSCAASGFGGTLSGSAGAIAGFASGQTASAALTAPFAATGCANLAFAPRVTTATSAKTSSANGAALNVTVTQPSGGSNLHSVAVTLPKQFAARLSTVQQSCPAATFAANPTGCPAASVVGSSTAATPVLTAPLQGIVYLVSRGAAGFPTLNVALSGSGITVDLTGTIAFAASGQTVSTFGSIPDVPISSFTLSLPEGPHSALAATGALCSGALVMPAALVAQSGAQRSLAVPVTVSGCPKAAKAKAVVLLSHRYRAGVLRLRLRVAAAGRVSASGAGLHTARVKVRRPGVIALSVRLGPVGLRALGRHHRFMLHLRLGFIPKKRGPSSIVRAVLLVRGR